MAAKNGRNVALTDEQNAMIDRLVRSGRYASASEVVRAGLRLLQCDEDARLLEKWLVKGLTPEEEAGLPTELLQSAREHVRGMIREGLADARRGDFVDGEQFFVGWKSRLNAARSKSRRAGVKR